MLRDVQVRVLFWAPGFKGGIFGTSFFCIPSVVCRKDESCLLILFLLDLPGVEQVMPNAVTASGNGCSRIHETASQPDGKYRVLLSEGLSGTDTFPESFSNGFSGPELKGAAEQRYQRDTG